MLVGWLGTQGSGPASVYLASDSRITWGSDGRRWDAGRKLFALRNSPDLLGYCGDVLIASQILGQLAETADHHLLFDAGVPAEKRHERMLRLFEQALSQGHRVSPSPFTVVHVARDHADKHAQFNIWFIHCAAGRLRDEHCGTIDAANAGNSRRLLALGSGAEAYVDETIRWDASAQGHTSRAYFTALCDVLKRGEDLSSGGVPQLIGLYRNGNGRSFGIVHEGARHFNGLALSEAEDYSSIEWRDETFQRINARTLKPVRGAQRQVRPILPPFGRG